MLKEIRKERTRFLKREGVEPSSIALDYYSGLDLLVESSKLFRNKNAKIEQLLLEGNRTEITKFIQSTTVFNMNIIIVDIIGDRGMLCQIQ